MHYYTNSFGYQPSSSNTNSWDPDTVLHLIHPDRGTYRCTGEAPSKRRRCMNQVGSFGSGRAMLSSLAQKEVSDTIESPDLKEAAKYTLCDLHKDQATIVSRQWSEWLRAWVSEKKKDTRTSGTPKSRPDFSFKHASKTNGASRNAKVKQEDSDTSGFDNGADGQCESLQDTLRKLKVTTKDLEAMMEKIMEKMMEAKEQEEKLKREHEAHSEEERRRKAQAKRKQEARWEEERRRKEQAKREQAARDKEEQNRKAREEQAAASRERVRLARERLHKEAKERAEREAEAWTQAWKRYTDAWDEVKPVKSEEFPEDRIPWPVKSGQYMDIDETNIKLFFKKGPPDNLVCTGEKRYRLFKEEILRWHPDKIMHKFGPDVYIERRKKALDTIAKVIVQLRQEAQRDRRS